MRNCGENACFTTQTIRFELKLTKKILYFQPFNHIFEQCFSKCVCSLCLIFSPTQYPHVLLPDYYMREDQSLSSCELLGSETSSFSFLFWKKKTALSVWDGRLTSLNRCLGMRSAAEWNKSLPIGLKHSARFTGTSMTSALKNVRQGGGTRRAEWQRWGQNTIAVAQGPWHEHGPSLFPLSDNTTKKWKQWGSINLNE